LKDYKYIPSTQSTNSMLKEMLKTESLPEFFVVRAAFQTAGKGQVGNSWESERGKNLLFSLLLRPHHIPIHEQFVLSQMVSVALVRALSQVGVDARIKWPNDIYVGNKKIAGILIENSLRNARIETSIIGVGLNVNQLRFVSDAPNPTSIAIITGEKKIVGSILSSIRNELMSLYEYSDFALLKQNYMQSLFRSNGVYSFKLPTGVTFNASIVDVCFDGKLVLESDVHEISSYYFKEIEFLF